MRPRICLVNLKIYIPRNFFKYKSLLYKYSDEIMFFDKIYVLAKDTIPIDLSGFLGSPRNLGMGVISSTTRNKEYIDFDFDSVNLKMNDLCTFFDKEINKLPNYDLNPYYYGIRTDEAS